MRQSGIPPTLETYHSILEYYAESDLADEALALLSDITACNVPPEEETFRLILTACRNMPDAHHAAIEMMADHGFTPDSIEIFELLIDFWARHHNLAMCIQELQSLFDKDIAPTLKIINPIVILAAEEGHPRLAIDLIQAYESGETERIPTSVWAQVLLTSATHSYEEGIRIALEKCEKEKVKLHEGLVMDILYCAARNNDLELAEKMFEALKELEVTLGEQHFAPLLDIRLKRGQISEGLGLIEVMRRQGIEVSDGLYYDLRQPLADQWDHIDDNLALLEALRDSGQQVPVNLLNTFLGAARFKQDLNRAMAIYRSFPSFKQSPTSETMNALLQLCVMDKNPVLANELWTELTEAGVEPGAGAYRGMIYLAMFQPEYEAMFYWLEEMKSKGIQPRADIYYAMIRRLLFLRDPRAKIALQELRDLGEKVRHDIEMAVARQWPAEGDAPPRRRERSRRGKGTEEQAVEGGEEEPTFTA